VFLARAWLHGLEAYNKGLWSLQQLGCTVWIPGWGLGLVDSLVWFGSEPEGTETGSSQNQKAPKQPALFVWFRNQKQLKQH
jgi:hypothetical protein